MNDTINVQRVAAFSNRGIGGNPAGVVLLNAAMSDESMRKTAADVGYSETAFAVPVPHAVRTWRVRYFSPETEVPFCGHATIALGSVLAERDGAGTYTLVINDATITVAAKVTEGGLEVTLTSPPTFSRPATETETSAAIALFGLKQGDLDSRLSVSRIHGGADHIVIALKDRAKLAAMDYDLSQGRELMRQNGLVTIMLVHVEGNSHFAVRNAFASGGVLEDPATGAAAAAFGGYLRDNNWPHGGRLTISQGEDMGAPSLIHLVLTDEVGSPVLVSGYTRPIAVD